MDHEQSLRMHIRKLLLPYALKHLTIDYAVYSQSEVIKLLSENLDIVPIEDPAFLTLPVEPMDAFYSLYRVKEQPGLTETWNVEAEVKDLIKKVVKTFGNVSDHVSTTTCLSFDEDSFQVFEPMSTVLTKRAISHTPVLGKSTLDHTKMISRPSMLSDFVRLKSVSERHIEQSTISTEDHDFLLGLHSIDWQGTSETVAFLSKECTGSRTGIKDQGDKRLANTQPSTTFLRDDSPPPIYAIREHMSPPIFSNRIKTHFQSNGPRKPSDIRSLGLIENLQPIRDEEEDISKEHMRVINGWTIMSEISSDTPSLDNSSQATEFDELFALSTPQKPSSPKMDEYLIPRTHHPGGGDVGQIRKKDHDVQNLSHFLSPLLPEMDVLPSSNSNAPKSSLPEIPLSMLGQPPSSLKSSAADATDDHKGSRRLASVKFRNQTPERLDALIETLCAPVRDECPEDWVLSERLEEKETMMMNGISQKLQPERTVLDVTFPPLVPKMKEPCIHPTSPSCPVVPKTPLSLFAAKKLTDDVGPKVNPNPPVTVLKKAPGLQSLNIELSWRPFNFQSHIPTIEELTDTQVFSPGTPDKDLLGEESVQNFLSFMETVGEKCDTTMNEESLLEDSMAFTHSFGGSYDIVLTNSERRKIYTSQLGPGRENVNHLILGNVTDEGEEFRDPVRIGRSNKKARMAPPPAINDLEMEIDTTVSGQATNAIDALRPGFANPEIDNPDCPLSRNNEVVEETTKRNDQVSPAGFAEACLYDSRRQVAETASGDRTSGDSSMDCIPPGMKWGNATAASQVKSPSNNSISKNSIKQLAALAPTRQALADFLHLRAKGNFTLNEPESLLSSPPPSPSGEEPTDEAPSPLREIPQELVDANTVKLPPDWVCPMTRLRYIGSLNVLQKTVLLEYLDSDCHIDLVERDNSETHGADLIIDRETALLYVPLSSLHFTREKLADRIASLSWRFELIVVVFEAFSLSTALRPRRLTEGNLTPYAFPAITVKAIKTLKRLLTVMEMIEPKRNQKATTKSPHTIVKYAYAQDVLEAAKFARIVGDETGATNMEWLCDEYTQDEIDLSHVSGMNIYAAALLLRYTDVKSFVDMSPAERFRQFVDILGEKRIVILNEEIETRLATLPNSSSSPATVLPFVEENAAAKVIETSPFEFDYTEDRTDVNWASTGLLGA